VGAGAGRGTAREAAGSGAGTAGSPREADEAKAGRAAGTSRWLLEEAVQQAAARHLAGFPTPVSVRLPASRLTDGSLSGSAVESLLARHELQPGSLILELAETDARISLDELEQGLSTLHQLGVNIALDAFGSGPLAVSALRRLPVDMVRLDRALIDGVIDSPRQRKITTGLLRMAGDLGLTSVAEGVDLPEQAVRLREMGCTHGQGAFFAGPLDEHRLRQALSRGAYPLPEPQPHKPPGRSPGRRRAGGTASSGRSGITGSARSAGGPVVGTGRPAEEQRRSVRSVVVAGALPVRMQERRESLPPWLVSGDKGEGADPAGQPSSPCSHAETRVPPA
jgi:EAL domain-containing protein (putative c-di-GMP-specific phosphodiesterase class I)